MKNCLLALLLLTAACNTTTNTSDAGNTNDGGTAFAAAYVGNWSGTVNLTADGQTVTTTGVLAIQETATNVIEFQGFCSDTDIYAAGPLADVTSSGFTVRADSCTYASSGCQAGDLTFSWSDGSGSLSNGEIDGSLDGSYTCGGVSTPYSLTLSATDKAAYGGESAGPGAQTLSPVLHMFRK